MLIEPARSPVTVALASLLVVGAAGLAGPGRADPLAITRWSVDGGGVRFSQAAPFVMAGTIGQPDAGLLVGAGFSIAGGFWIPGRPIPLGVGDGGSDSPAPDAVIRELVIHPASPNPMASRARIAFDLPDEREGLVEVFDLNGALRRTVAGGRFGAGVHRFEWDGRNSDGRRVGAGIYLVRVRLGAIVRTQKLVVLQ